MKNIILKKIIILSLVSLVCITIGVTYGIITNDRVFVIMSSLIGVVNVYKIWDLHKIGKDKKYISITGKCVGTTYNFLGKYKICKFLCAEELLELSVPRNMKFVSDEEYVLYFIQKNTDVLKYDTWLKNRMLSGSFLGFEKVTGRSE